MANINAELFIKATKNHYRFQGTGFIASVEDLWELGTPQIDSAARNIEAQMDEFKKHPMSLSERIKFDRGDGSSDVDETESKRLELREKLEILTYIVSVRQEEEEERVEAANRAITKKRILEVIAKKEDQKLDDMTIEELKSLLDA